MTLIRITLIRVLSMIVCCFMMVKHGEVREISRVSVCHHGVNRSRWAYETLYDGALDLTTSSVELHQVTLLIKDQLNLGPRVNTNEDNITHTITTQSYDFHFLHTS